MNDNRVAIPTATVIVPAFNSQNTISLCIESLLSQDYPSHLIEIIVVDDGSTDRTVEIAQKYNIKIISQKNSGPATARNAGIKEATADIVLFTDADCRPDHDWVRKMLAAFRDSEVVAVKGAYRTVQQEVVARFVQYEYQEKYQWMSGFANIDFIDTYSAGFRKQALLDIGGYDESFRLPSVEDQELSFRLAACGYKMVFQPEATVKHLHSDSFWKYAKKKFKIGYYKAFLLGKHPNKVKGDSHTPTSLKYQIILALLGIASLIVSICYNLVWRFFLLIWFAFLLSTIGFCCKIWDTDKQVSLIAPIILAIRSISLGLGLLCGIPMFIHARLQNKKQNGYIKVQPK